jgi:serine/threonine protein kinase
MPMPRAAADPMLPGATEFCDLVDALAGLHAVGWVHRDPRPTNFFRDAAGSFFLADLGSAAPIGDETVWIDDERPWAPQYGPLAVLRAVAAGVAQPLPAPAHDFEQVARLAYASSSRAAETMPAQGSELCKWWEQQDKTPFLSALLPAAAAAATGDAAAREAFKEALRTWVALP